MESRRDFFGSLLSGGATVTNGLSGRKRGHDAATNAVLYRGPMRIPDDVRAAVEETPNIHRTRGGKRKLAMRYSADGVVWLFRYAVPAHGAMVGEVVRTIEGKYRVHAWQAAHPGEYRAATEFITRDSTQVIAALPRSWSHEEQD
jgi:hypothetical protein